ncbi:MAG: type IV pilin protein [Rubrivivax sp.]
MRNPLSVHRSAHGFSLIELVIAIAILGIVGSLAYPSFMGSIRKGRRAEAFAALSAVQQAQERWRANNASYASNLSAAAPAGLGLSATTGGGLYTISLANTSATGYDAVATAVSGTTQIDDTTCAKLGVRMNNGNLTYAGAGAAGSLSYAATSTCWNR